MRIVKPDVGVGASFKTHAYKLLLVICLRRVAKQGRVQNVSDKVRVRAAVSSEFRAAEAEEAVLSQPWRS